MSNLFFGFYSLAACVAAAVSQSKKAVSAAAAVVVGIGLLTAPIDSAQAQTGIPEVTHLIFLTDEASDYELSQGWDAVWANIDVSGAYRKWYHTNQDPSSDPGNPSSYEGYFKVRITPEDDEDSGDFIDVYFYVDRSGGGVSISVWVEDSEGNEYTVGGDFTVVFW